MLSMYSAMEIILKSYDLPSAEGRTDPVGATSGADSEPVGAASVVGTGSAGGCWAFFPFPGGGGWYFFSCA